MSISRSLNLSIKLNGYATVKKQLQSLLTDATKLQQKLSNMTVSFSGSESTPNFNVNNIANDLKNAATETQKINNDIGKSLIVSSTKALANEASILEIKRNQLQVTRSTAIQSDYIYRQFANLNPKWVGNNLDDIGTKRLDSNNIKRISSTPQNLMLATESKVLDMKNRQLDVVNRSAKIYEDLYKNRINYTNNIYENENGNLEDLAKKSRSLIQTGFGLHIVQIYLAPILYALEKLTSKMISTYAEFDKLYTDYMVKSEEYGEWLNKSDFYSSSVGQTYGILDAASAAERFAASGVDVAKSQQALTSVMQVATIAQMDYDEAANGVIRTMQAMHMNVEDVTIITDALINSANASTAELDDLVQWFEYAASSAFQAGLDVKQLSAYLGILASTGTPNTGAAMRQLFLQLSKEDIQSKMKDQFSWINDESFANVDQLILDMRDYVRSQDDQKAATLEITRLLGGKANAQQALNNLLMSEPELWNQVTNAVNATGSTQDLYNKITDNTADSIQRIKVNFDIWMAQLGEVVGPGIKFVADAFTALTTAFIALPSWIKKIIGAAIILATVFAAVTFTIIGAVGAIAIITGTLIQLQLHQGLIILATKGWRTALKELAMELYGIVFAGTSYNTTLTATTVNSTAATAATKSLTLSKINLRSVMMGITGAMIGYTMSASAMQKQMFSEAYVIGHLTALWLAYSAAKAAAVLGPVASGVAALGAFGAYEAIMYNQIETMKRDARLTDMANQIGTGSTVNKNYYINMDNATISSEGTGLEDFISAFEVDDIE